MSSRAIRIEAAGGPEVLRFAEIEVAAPGPDEVLIRHTAIGVNMIDTYHRASDSGQYAIEKPAVIGVEAAGIVEEVGPNVTAVGVGDRVAYFNVLGAYAERRTIPAWRLVTIPEGVSDEIAAAALLKGSTAFYLLHRVWSIKSGDTILVHAAAGGVGQLLCQWASRAGATVIGTAGGPDKVEAARRAGCAHVISYSERDFLEGVREIVGDRGVDVVFDSVGRETFLKSLDCLRPLGTMVNFGQASGPVEPFDISLLARKGSVFLAKPTLATFTQTHASIADLANGVFSALADGIVSVDIGHRAPLAQAAEVHRMLESRGTTGSTILIP